MLATMLIYCCSGMVSAQVYELHIPDSSAPEALESLAEKTGRSLFYPSNDLVSVKTRAIDGIYTLPEALDLMLEGSNLNAVVTNQGVIVISVATDSNKGEIEREKSMNVKKSFFAVLIGVISGTGGAHHAIAQDDDGTSKSRAAIEEVIVTAQKREQNLQEVPIAVTALSEDALKVNGVTSVMDLNAMVPNITVQNTAGSVGQPSFGIRGVMTQGSNPGQDKAFGIYLDGVALGSLFGFGFETPGLERIEVLRGPQGTLFGRNTTAGAVSIMTSDPSGEFSFRQQLTTGNYDQFKSITRIETPTWGPFSALIAYAHDERDGDIKNLGAGQEWDVSIGGLGTLASPETLGAKDMDSWFVALQFEPSDNFRLVYKYDRMENDFTPVGNSIVAYTPGPYAPANLLAAYAENPPPLAGTSRPKYVNNSNTLPSYNESSGHNLTAYLDISDNLSLKNVFGYRKSYIYSIANIDGLGGLMVDGDPYSYILSIASNDHKQWSDEIQLNYNTDSLTLTTGAIYFDQEGYEGPPGLLPRIPYSQVVTDGVYQTSTLTNNNFEGQSWAVYTQAEFHVTPQMDLVGGYRFTNDQKSGTNQVKSVPFTYDYDHSESTYSLGTNYKLSDETLLYAKYSTGYVSGGAIADIPFEPETVKSWEGGVKTDLFDNRLRFNLALFHSKYDDVQGSTSGRNLGRRELGTVVITEGNLTTKGVELEFTAVPMPGLTLNGNYGYTDFSLKDVSELLCPPSSCEKWLLRYRAKSTAVLSAQYETEPLFGEATLVVRIDGNWRSKQAQIPRFPYTAGHEIIVYSPAGWVANARVALRDIALSSGNLEIALWSRNLFDQDRATSPLTLGDVAGTTYEPARTYGLDVIYNY